MGVWDELCLLCGISPCPPSTVNSDLDEVASELLKESPSLLNDYNEDTLADLLRSAEDLTPFTDITSSGYSSTWGWSGFTECMAVGHFYEDGDTPHQLVEDELSDASGNKRWKRRIPDGKKVVTYILNDPSCGEFRETVLAGHEKVFRTGSSNYIYPELSKQDGFGNFFLSEGCYRFLQHWIDRDSLPVSTSRPTAELGFVGELYEVVNSRIRGRVNGVGTLPWLSYDDIDFTLEQTQDYCDNLRRSWTHTLASLCSGSASPDALMVTMMKDHRCWMFSNPTLYPDPDEQSASWTYSPITFSCKPGDDNMQNHLSSLPTEILENIVSKVSSLPSYFRLASKCKSIYHVLMDSAFLVRAFREMTSSPSHCLFWILPVPHLPCDSDHFEEAVAKWMDFRSKHTIATGSQTFGIENVKTTFRRPECPTVFASFSNSSFPTVAFVKACFYSDTMRNRRRIWGQVKQFELVWRDYRLRGWEVDRFGVPLPS